MQEVKVKIKKEQADTQGNKITAQLNINFAQDLKGVNINELKEAEGQDVKSQVQEFEKNWLKYRENGGITKFNEWLYTTFMEQDNGQIKNFRSIPEISPDTLQADPGL